MLKALYERLNVKVQSVHSCKNKGVFKHVYFLCTFFYLSDSLINKHVQFIAAHGWASFGVGWGGGGREGTVADLIERSEVLAFFSVPTSNYPLHSQKDKGPILLPPPTLSRWVARQACHISSCLLIPSENLSGEPKVLPPTFPPPYGWKLDSVTVSLRTELVVKKYLNMLPSQVL